MAFTHLMPFVRAYGEEWSQGTLWTKLTRYALSLLSFRLYLVPFHLGQLGMAFLSFENLESLSSIGPAKAFSRHYVGSS